MSEYQSYEFRAIDQPLDPDVQAKLRRISSRGEVTPSSFSNEYNWGDFKGDPVQLMWDGFDVFAYYANWGTHWCMFRIPRGVFDEVAEQYQCEMLSVSVSKTHQLLDFRCEDEPPDYDYDVPWIGRLMSVRAELLAGDARPLMLGWLAGCWGLEDDDPVPPIPPGMGELTATQESLADFLYVDVDLLAAVAERSVEAAPPPSRDQAAAWLASQPAETKDRWLLGLLDEPSASLGAQLWAEFQRSLDRPESAAEPWTVGELRARQETIAPERERREAEAAERERLAREQAEREARHKRLACLVGQEDSLRLRVKELTMTTQPKNYDEAVRILVDLQSLAEMSGELSEFELTVQELRERYSRKRTLLERLERAGL